MNRTARIIIVVALAAAIVIVLQARRRRNAAAIANQNPAAVALPGEPEMPATAKESVRLPRLPRLLDLGAEACVPCRMMAPILDQLRTEYEGRLEVIFIDVRTNPDAAREHKIRVIPTQIFFAADGTEVFRHEGFFSREEILAKWRELGHAFEKNDADEPPAPAAGAGTEAADE